MQKATRKFQEKIETIHKIQYRNHKKHEPPPSSETHASELPPITNSLTSPRKHNNLNNTIPLSTIVPTNNKKIDNDYDAIINQTLSQFKNQKINRIIFASPLNRLGKTYYRKNEFKTIDSWPFRNQNEQKNKMDSMRKKEFQDYLQNHVKKHKYVRQSYKNMTASIPQERNTTYQQTNSIYFTAPDQTEKDPLPYGFRRNNKRSSRERKTQLNGRYSPWKQQQQQESLVGWYK